MKKRVLLVVDDWEALEVYETRLTPHFEVHCAPFGTDGIRMARELKPDRIFLDLTFEDMTAKEACEILRADSSLRSIPLTLILNEVEEIFAIEGIFPLPGDNVLCRPYEMSQLLEKLSQSLA